MSRMLVFMVMLNLPACYAWQRRSPEQQRRDPRPATLRFMLPDGGRVVMVNGVVTGDSLIGTSSGSDARLAVHVQRIQDLAIRRLDPATTSALALGFLVAGAGAFALVSTDTCGSGAAGSC